LQHRKANTALKNPATAVATQLEQLKKESAALINEMEPLGGQKENSCKIIEECEKHFEEEIECIARMHERSNEDANAKKKYDLDDGM